MHQHIYLQKMLEHTFDIPFASDGGIIQHDPWYTMRPYSEDGSLFLIRLNFRNAIRLIMDFEPQRFSANLIQNMELANEEQKLAFCSYARILRENGGKIELAINNHDADPFNSINWPRGWRHFHIRVTVMPITNQENPYAIPYLAIADEWGRLMMGMILSLLDIVPLGEPENKIVGYEEGKKTKVLTNRYERNPINRYMCIRKFGHKCQICGFDFEEVYGEVGQDFIHVHHLIPVSRMFENYVIDPLKDLTPVCANCHAMLHKKDPPFSIDELRAKMNKL